jgi:hypothetical protein
MPTEDAEGVHPEPDCAKNESAANAWVEANCFVRGSERSKRAVLLQMLVTDSVAAGRDRITVQRVFHCARAAGCMGVPVDESVLQLQ